MEEINMQSKPKIVSIVDFKIKIWAKRKIPFTNGNINIQNIGLMSQVDN